MSTVKAKININDVLKELSVESLKNNHSNLTFGVVSKDCFQESSKKTNNEYQPIKKVILKLDEIGLSQKNHARKGSKVGKQKENKYIESLQSSRELSYLQFSKSLEDKNSKIDKQKQEIMVLKKMVTQIKTNQQYQKSQEQRVRTQQLQKLRVQEQDYVQNLKELESLKSSLKQIKKKYQIILHQKNNLTVSNNVLMTENQELTVTIHKLKQQLAPVDRSSNLDFELHQIKQNLALERIEKQKAQNRYAISQEKCQNLEVKLSQYIKKQSQMQETLNNWQNRYNQLKKECDNYRSENEEWKNKHININEKFQIERLSNVEIKKQLKMKIDSHQQQTKAQQLLIYQLKQKIGKNNVSNLQWQTKMNQQIKLFNFQRDKLKNQINILIQALTQQNSNYQSIRIKSIQLIDQNQRIMRHYKSLLSKKEEELAGIEKKCQFLVADLNSKNGKQQIIKQRISSLQMQLIQNDKHVQNQIQQVNQDKKQLQKIIQQQRINFQSKISQNINTIETLRDQNNDLKQQISYLKQEKNNFNQQYFSISQKATAYKYRIDNMQNQLANCKVKEDFQLKYEWHLQEYNRICEKLNQLQSQNTKLRKTNSINVIQINYLKNEIELVKSDFEAIENSKQSQSYISIIQQLQSKIGFLQQKMIKAQQSFIEKESVIHKFESLCKSKTETIQQMQLQMLSIRNLTKKQNQQINRKLSDALRQKQAIIQEIKVKVKAQFQQIGKLTQSLTQAQQRYHQLTQRYNQDLNAWQQQKSQLKRQWIKLLELNEQQKKELQGSCKSVDMQLQNSRLTISILKQENSQYEKILTEELQKRNIIIRELIQQKKILYEQLVIKNS